MKINNAVICAAGLGSRLGLDTPKCLIQIGKHKIIYYLLELLKDVKNIRIVVGFKEQEVIDYVRNIRQDVVFVRNPNYQSTTNAHSLYLGSKDLKNPYLMIDGDMIIDQDSFKNFIVQCKKKENLIGISKVKTDDAVFTRTNQLNQIIEFSRNRISDYEWCGLAYFSSVTISKDGHYVYQEVEKVLPIDSTEVVCWEIDTPDDLSRTINELNLR